MALLQITIRTDVPAWTAGVIEAAAPFDTEVHVRLDPDESAIVGDLTGPAAAEALAGWEIGVLMTLFQLGATDVVGASPERMARVRAIAAQLDAGEQR